MSKLSNQDWFNIGDAATHLINSHMKRQLEYDRSIYAAGVAWNNDEGNFVAYTTDGDGEVDWEEIANDFEHALERARELYKGIQENERWLSYMSSEQIAELLKTSLLERKEKGLKTLSWEDPAKSFVPIEVESILPNLLKIYYGEDSEPPILKCETELETYFFGLGLQEIEYLRDFLDLCKFGQWYIYTWDY